MNLQARKSEMMTAAVTLSDMEIFIFPDLLMAGALANLMSPMIWRWRDDPYFRNIEELSTYQRIQRVKQYIISHFTFNLDLETWGLTTKQREKDRFAPFVDFAQVENSNALMGYEGDRYYYDIDIRRHFGLEKYTADVLPYWKTETVEAMTAFRRKDGYAAGAGECVSLSLLYYAALHIVAGIPLSKMYMIATPLHSQNFIDVDDGILTNNRRLVTKSMWFNGTPLSSKAQRALRHEQVTIVSHIDGYVHTMYDEGTMGEETYGSFCEKLQTYLTPTLNLSSFYAFLRGQASWRPHFYCRGRHKKTIFYATAESLYDLDAQSDLKMAPNTCNKMMQRLAEAAKMAVPPTDRSELTSVTEDQFAALREDNLASWPAILGDFFPTLSPDQCEKLAAAFHDFCFVTPRLPAMPSIRQDYPSLALLDCCRTRDEVIACVKALRGKNPVADLAFAAYRDLHHMPWLPFLKASLERNPVSVTALQPFSLLECEEIIRQMEGDSIYEGDRLAQPDEVWNFHGGDGLEKALLFWNILVNRQPAQTSTLEIAAKSAVITAGNQCYCFEGQKNLPPARFRWSVDGLQPLAKDHERGIAVI